MYCNEVKYVQDVTVRCNPTYLTDRWSLGTPHKAGPPTGRALLWPCRHRGWSNGGGRSLVAIWWIPWNRRTSRTNFRPLRICQIELLSVILPTVAQQKYIFKTFNYTVISSWCYVGLQLFKLLLAVTAGIVHHDEISWRRLLLRELPQEWFWILCQVFLFLSVFL